MTHTVVDHLVVAAASLEQGVAWCEATFGFTPTAGGKHPLMGTHNRVFAVATPEYPLAYFEIIAIDPEAQKPARPRWFGLDEPALQARLAQQGPQLIHFVARTPMLDMHRWGLISIGLRPGDPVAVQRETPHGTLSWQILVPEDGRPECGGALPTLIQWGPLHPAENLPASGVTLKALALRGVPDRARELLRLRGARVQQALGAGEPALSATLLSASGEVVLQSPR